jgi:hypothetical protein
MTEHSSRGRVTRMMALYIKDGGGLLSYLESGPRLGGAVVL